MFLKCNESSKMHCDYTFRLVRDIRGVIGNIIFFIKYFGALAAISWGPLNLNPYLAGFTALRGGPLEIPGGGGGLTILQNLNIPFNSSVHLRCYILAAYGSKRATSVINSGSQLDWKENSCTGNFLPPFPPPGVYNGPPLIMPCCSLAIFRTEYFFSRQTAV